MPSLKNISSNIVADIHKAYFDSGCDIVETNTFNANKISQLDYGMEDYCYELNYEAAKIARNTAKSYSDKPRFVAGAIGPTNRTGSLSPDVNNPGFRNISFDELKDAYYEQAKGLFDGCVDLFLIESYILLKTFIIAPVTFYPSGMKKNNISKIQLLLHLIK